MTLDQKSQLWRLAFLIALAVAAAAAVVANAGELPLAELPEP
jgi:hypothetical protein